MATSKRTTTHLVGKVISRVVIKQSGAKTTFFPEDQYKQSETNGS